MPIYEFQCGNCGGTSEAIEGVIRQEQSVICPLCGGRNMIRLPSRGVGTPKRGSSGGVTCCGRQERCELPPCTTEERCRR